MAKFVWTGTSGAGKTYIKELFDVLFATTERSGSSKRKPWGVILALTAAIMGVHFFVNLPSLSPMGSEFYFFIILGILIYWALTLFFGRKPKTYLPLTASAVVAILCVLVPVVGGFLSSPLFRAKDYANLITLREGVFAEEVDNVTLDQVPIVDREAAQVIGEKQMGGMVELVSQFEIGPTYSQINIAGKPIRVSPLRYAGLIKYLGNFRNGIEYFISVDMTTQNGELNKLANPIRYSESDWIFRDLDRHLRFKYPFALLGANNFEIDDEGNAWYVTPKLTKRIGFFNGLDSSGVILTNANTGESTFYSTEDIPDWVDRAYPSELIIQQLDWRGLYSGGYFNSMIGQRSVTSTTDGYNYISLGTDIYLITGVTSVRADSSNLGFYYVNLRTKEAVFYACPSATETAAMQSARGKVQEKNYVPTFPVILNIQDRPVYFMSLKDQSLTAKMFALVDAEHFTNVVVGNTVKEVIALFYEQNPGERDPNAPADVEESLTIKTLVPLVLEGNSVFYFTVEENDMIYMADPALLGPSIAFLEPGDKVIIISQENESSSFVLTLKEE